ncbi:MAG: hypothetical protein R2795_07915 [Saprospiraceae bacterium]
MKNVLLKVLVLWGGSICYTACQSNTSSATTEVLFHETIEMESTNGWKLMLQQDGSGYLSNPSKGVRQIWFVPGSLSFQRLRLLPPFTPETRTDYPYRWKYTNWSTGEELNYGLPDSLWAAQWFDNAVNDLPIQGKMSRRALKLWHNMPPPGAMPLTLKNW